MDSSILEKIAGFLQDMAEPAVKILPLFLLFGLVKTISSVDNLISKVSGNLSKSAGGFGEQFSKDMDNRRQLQAKQGRGLYGGILGANRRRKERRNNVSAGIESELKRSRADYHAKQVEESESYRNRVAGGTRFQQADQSALNRALANAINVRAQIDVDEVKAANAIIKNADVNLDDLAILASGSGPAKGLNGSDMAIRRAAMQQLIKSNDVDKINKIVDDSLSWSHANDQNASPEERTNGSKLRATLSEALGDSSGRPAWLTKGVLAGIENGENKADTTALIRTAINDNVYSPQNISTADKVELKTVQNVITNIDSKVEPALAAKAQAVVANANTALTDDKLKVTLAKNFAAVTSLASAKTK